MKAWEGWSLRQWDKWGSKLQPAYTSIDNWKTPEWAKKIFKVIWEELDEEVKKKLYKLVMETCKQFDDKFAKELLRKIAEAVKKRLKI